MLLSRKKFLFFLFTTEAYLLLHLGYVFVLFIPFRRLASWLGKADYETETGTGVTQVSLNISRSILAASRFTLHRSRCFDQALAGLIMLRLRRLSCTIYFGVSKIENEPMVAHVWIRNGGLVVTGGAVALEYRTVAFFGTNGR